MPRQEAPMSFRKFAAKAAEIVGSSQSFFFALGIILAWLAWGPAYCWPEGHRRGRELLRGAATPR